MSDRVEQRMLGERTRLLFENGRASSLVVILAGCMLSIIMFGKISNVANFVWLGAIVSAASLRLTLVLWRHRDPEAASVQSWARRYTLATALIGGGWAWFAIIGFGHSVWMNMVVLIIVLSITSLAVPVLISFPFTLYVYFMPAMLTVIILLLVQPDLDQALLAACTLFYGLLILRSAQNFYQILLESLHLRFRNEALADGLNKEKESTEELNQKLAEEVEERRNAQKALEAHKRDLENQVQLRTTELVEAKDAAEAGNRAKSDFLASISHEIRTPLNGVLGVTQLLRTSKLSDKQQRYVEIAHDAAAALRRLIDDILDFSMIESGQFSISDEAFNLDRVLQDSLQVVEEQARKKKIELVFDSSVAAGVLLRGDGYRLRQILLNLVGNAIKFTDTGWVRLSVRELRGGSDDEFRHFLFEVRDTGVGIDAGALDQIFDVFTQEDGSITRRFGGTGLGLSITRRLAETMGGAITVESTKGVGSSFRVELPFAAHHTSEKTRSTVEVAGPEVPRFSGRVLVAEDNQVNQIIACEHLKAMGFAVATADNGRRAREERADGDYCLILMDCHMPEMDGFDATQAIRRDESVYGWENVPIIAFTADAEPATRGRCEAAGMDGYVVKPLDLAALVTEIQGVLGN